MVSGNGTCGSDRDSPQNDSGGKNAQILIHHISLLVNWRDGALQKNNKYGLSQQIIMPQRTGIISFPPVGKWRGQHQIVGSSNRSGSRRSGCARRASACKGHRRPGRVRGFIRDKVGRQRNASGLCGLEIDDQWVSCRLLKRQIAGQCCRLHRLSRDKVLGATSLAHR
jgi:hypothetical protein